MSAFSSGERRELRARVRDAAQRSARTGRAIPAWLARSETPADAAGAASRPRGAAIGSSGRSGAEAPSSQPPAPR